jgi:hypothetical protein
MCQGLHQRYGNYQEKLNKLALLAPCYLQLMVEQVCQSSFLKKTIKSEHPAHLNLAADMKGLIKIYFNGEE